MLWVIDISVVDYKHQGSFHIMSSQVPFALKLILHGPIFLDSYTFGNKFQYVVLFEPQNDFIKQLGVCNMISWLCIHVHIWIITVCSMHTTPEFSKLKEPFLV